MVEFFFCIENYGYSVVFYFLIRGSVRSLSVRK